MPAVRNAILALSLLLAPVLLQGRLDSPRAAEAPGTQAEDAPAIAPVPAAPGLVLDDDAPSSVRIFSPPPTRWDRPMINGAPALHQGQSDLVALTGGVFFGLLPREVNALLPAPTPGIGWGMLPQAAEFPGDVRYFWVPFQDAGPLRMGSKRCVGAGSYLVFLFTEKGLFRLSYRLVPDRACPSVNETARDVFGRYVTIDSRVALTMRYRTGSAEVVDVTDPGASFLIPVRWYQVGR